MAEPVLRVTAAGVTAGSLQENVEALNERQREAFGGDLALTPSLPQSQWSGIAGLALSETGEAAVRIAGALNADSAAGTLLDVLGSPLDVRRQGATHSRVVATLTGVAGTIIPEGTRAKTGDDDEFETTEVVTIPSGGSIDVVMQAVETGAVQAAAGALDRIVTGVPGWETITNAAAAVPGRARQADSVYRRLYRERTAHSSSGPVTGLKGALVEAGADRSVVVRNNTNAAAANQDWSIPAHGIFAVVEGGSTRTFNAPSRTTGAWVPRRSRPSWAVRCPWAALRRSRRPTRSHGAARTTPWRMRTGPGRKQCSARHGDHQRHQRRCHRGVDRPSLHRSVRVGPGRYHGDLR